VPEEVLYFVLQQETQSTDENKMAGAEKGDGRNISGFCDAGSLIVPSRVTPVSHHSALGRGEHRKILAD